MTFHYWQKIGEIKIPYRVLLKQSVLDCAGFAPDLKAYIMFCAGFAPETPILYITRTITATII